MCGVVKAASPVLDQSTEYMLLTSGIRGSVDTLMKYVVLQPRNNDLILQQAYVDVLSSSPKVAAAALVTSRCKNGPRPSPFGGWKPGHRGRFQSLFRFPPSIPAGAPSVILSVALHARRRTGCWRSRRGQPIAPCHPRPDTDSAAGHGGA
jgi:hypothetical protein